VNKSKFNLRSIVLVSMFLAIAIALDVVTGMIPGLNLSMPLGGRIFNVSLLPIILIGILIGPFYGLSGAIIYGVFGFFYDGYALAYFSQDLFQATLVFMLDYVVAFGALGLSGFFKRSLNKPYYLIITISVVLLIRFVSSTIVGAILWVGYASGSSWTENLLTNVGNNALIYSGIYNIIYTLTTLVTLSIISVLMFKQLKGLKEQYNSLFN